MSGHAIISGGSSGIGLAIARELASSGWRLSLLARDRDRLAASADLLAADGAMAVRVHPVDVADQPALAAAVQEAVAALGPPSLLIAAAGMVVPGHFAELEDAAFTRTMAVNYLGSLHLVRAALPALRRVPGSRIVLLSSGAGLIGLYGYTAYAPTKFAVRGLAEALRSELAPEGIGVSVVFPPDTDTPQLHAERRLRPLATSRIAAGARVQPADAVARAILRGVRRNRFVIAPGWEMAALAWLHSFVGPLLHRFWFDRIIRGCRRQPPAGDVSGITCQPAQDDRIS
ncbi:MAG TPA: SDR family NAD(P)-dependent oxidoreductase [Geminicoccus sp.]|uniref:SDR family NAD(P)-dependent oxidoreductase n=1 Tax=Geminicoccus sp. TaxID=2024832 RepID=UPI002BCCF69D|nr:SDR family NAD(P)-dependent oxidoreductase [Geminicoccus sp.]HWL68251.1 SDR family NAD(P)-dependent oxidoreductase [Geminicoccus sp.]